MEMFLSCCYSHLVPADLLLFENIVVERIATDFICIIFTKVKEL
jgi:hypothetical protein